MSALFSVTTSFPPSLAKQPPLAMLTVMSFWVVFVICLQWIYDTIDQAREVPAPKGSYLRTVRNVRLWLVSAALVLTTPRLASLMLWQLMTPVEREALAAVAWLVCIPAAAMIVYAWWINRSSVRAEQQYVAHRGYYLVQPATKSEKTRGLLVLAVVFVIAFATTFVRPPNDDASRPSISQRP